MRSYVPSFSAIIILNGCWMNNCRSRTTYKQQQVKTATSLLLLVLIKHIDQQFPYQQNVFMSSGCEESNKQLDSIPPSSPHPKRLIYLCLATKYMSLNTTDCFTTWAIDWKNHFLLIFLFQRPSLFCQWYNIILPGSFKKLNQNWTGSL